MKLTFIGADHEVTGSCHYVECGSTKFIVDYGMEQGFNRFENVPLPVSIKEIDYVLITHAHIDHTGLLPELVKGGFTGTILCTNACLELLKIMLLDSANIQVSDTEYKNKKNRKAGKPEVEPRFTIQDAKDIIDDIRAIPYNELVELSDDVSVRFIDAGHLLGSSSIECFLKEDGVKKKIVFSGDIGNFNKPLIRDPQYIDSADYVLTEATYGDRDHNPYKSHTNELADIIQRTFDRGGNVIIPAFAVGRTQEVLYFINEIKTKHLVKNHDGFEVWVDSPLASEATRVFQRNLLECYDEETKALVEKGINPIEFQGLMLSVTTEESKMLNELDYPKIIISASGMCDAGRIRHHLKRNVGRAESTVIFAGYQGDGTLGRKLQDGDEYVTILGDRVEVLCEVATLDGISSHADKEGLLTWMGAFTKQMPTKVFVVHAEDEVAESYSKLIAEKFGLDVEAPFSGSVYDLKNNRWVTKTVGIPIEHDGNEKVKDQEWE